MRSVLYAGFAFLWILFICAPSMAAPNLNAATLPDSRSVGIGATATYFAVITNSGDTAATGCSIALSAFSSAPVTVGYQTTDSANVLTGTADTPVDIAAGVSQNFLVSVTPSAAFEGTVKLAYSCDAGVSAFNQPAVNDVLLTAETGTPPDVISIIATPSADGVVRVLTSGGAEAVGISAINIGGGGDASVTVTPSVSNFADLATLTICETDSAGTCTSALGPSVDTTIGATAKTFSVFVDAPDGGGVGLLPAYTRIKIDITERSAPPESISKGLSGILADGTLRGATSAAYTAPAGDNPPDIPAGVYDFQIRDQVNDPTGDFISGGQLIITPDGTSLGWVRRIDGTPVIQAFQMTGDFFPDNAAGPIFGGNLEFLETTDGVAALNASMTFTYEANASFLGQYSFTAPPDLPNGKLQIGQPQFLPTSSLLSYLGAFRIALSFQEITIAILTGGYSAKDPNTGASLGSASIDNTGVLSATFTPPGLAEACILTAGFTPLETLGIMTLVDLSLAQCGLPQPTAALAYYDPISFATVQTIRLILVFGAIGMVLDMEANE